MKFKSIILLLLCFLVSGYLFGGSDYPVVFKISPVLSFSLPFGDLISREMNSWELQVKYDDGTVKRAKPDIFNWALRLSAEMVFWDKVGLEMGYTFINSFHETVEVGGEENYKKYSYSGNFMNMSAFTAGMNYYFSSFNTIFGFYAGPQVGFAWTDINPNATLNDFYKNKNISYPTYIGPLQAFQIGANAGFNLVLSPFTCGFSIGYNHYFAFSDSAMRAYKSSDTAFNFGSVSFQFSAGYLFL